MSQHDENASFCNEEPIYLAKTTKPSFEISHCFTCGSGSPLQFGKPVLRFTSEDNVSISSRSQIEKPQLNEVNDNNPLLFDSTIEKFPVDPLFNKEIDEYLIQRLHEPPSPPPSPHQSSSRSKHSEESLINNNNDDDDIASTMMIPIASFATTAKPVIIPLSYPSPSQITKNSHSLNDLSTSDSSSASNERLQQDLFKHQRSVSSINPTGSATTTNSQRSTQKHILYTTLPTNSLHASYKHVFGRSGRAALQALRRPQGKYNMKRPRASIAGIPSSFHEEALRCNGDDDEDSNENPSIANECEADIRSVDNTDLINRENLRNAKRRYSVHTDGKIIKERRQNRVLHSSITAGHIDDDRQRPLSPSLQKTLAMKIQINNNPDRNSWISTSTAHNKTDQRNETNRNDHHSNKYSDNSFNYSTNTDSDYTAQTSRSYGNGTRAISSRSYELDENTSTFSDGPLKVNRDVSSTIWGSAKETASNKTGSLFIKKKTKGSYHSSRKVLSNLMSASYVNDRGSKEETPLLTLRDTIMGEDYTQSNDSSHRHCSNSHNTNSDDLKDLQESASSLNEQRTLQNIELIALAIVGVKTWRKLVNQGCQAECFTVENPFSWLYCTDCTILFLPMQAMFLVEIDHKVREIPLVDIFEINRDSRLIKHIVRSRNSVRREALNTTECNKNQKFPARLKRKTTDLINRKHAATATRARAETLNESLDENHFQAPQDYIIVQRNIVSNAITPSMLYPEDAAKQQAISATLNNWEQLSHENNDGKDNILINIENQNLEAFQLMQNYSRLIKTTELRKFRNKMRYFVLIGIRSNTNDKDNLIFLFRKQNEVEGFIDLILFLQSYHGLTMSSVIGSNFRHYQRWRRVKSFTIVRESALAEDHTESTIKKPHTTIPGKRNFLSKLFTCIRRAPGGGD